VAAATMVRDRFLAGQVDVREVKLLSDKITGQGGKERVVAAIEIVIERK